MIAERAVKANRKVVNQRLLIALNGTETANMIPDPHNIVATGSFGGLSSPKQSSNNINQWSFYQIFRMSSRPAHMKSPTFDEFLGTVLDSQFVGQSFLPRRIEGSTTLICVYLYT